MKKALIGTAVATGILLSTPSVMADTGYVGIDYQMFRLVTDDSGDFEPEGAALRLGGSLSDYVMVEARLGASTGGDAVDDVSFKVDDFMGFYVKTGVDLANLVFPYVAVGLTKVDLVTDDMRETEGDMSYGVGADVHFGSLQAGIEWMMLLDETHYELKTGTLSLAWRF